MLEIFLILLKLLVFTLISFVFGWLMIKRFLREKSLAFKIGASFLFGFAFYTFLLNILSYFVPIKFSFYLSLLILLFFILLNKGLLIRQIRKIKTLDWKKCLNPIFITTLVIFLSVFWTGLGFHREDLLTVHTPTAVTIAEGNFPIFHVAYAPVKLIYHYAPELLAAAIYKITGLPLWLVYDFLFALFACLIFVFAFVLVKELTKKFKAAYWGALAMLLAGGFYFIYIFTGIKPLYNKFVLNQDIESPFAFFSSVLGRDYLSQPLISAAGNHSLALAWGLVLVLAIFCLFLKFFRAPDKKWFFYVIIISILFGFSALSSEVLFGIVGLILGLYLILTLISQKLRDKQRVLGLLIILFIGGLIAIFQGGLFSQLLDSVDDFNKWTFRLSDEISIGGHAPISLFSFTILRAFGLSLILLPFALFYWRKKRDVLLLILLPVLISFLIPFVIDYAGIGDLQRFFIIALAFLGLFVGLYLGDLLGRYPVKKIIIYFLILILILNGLTYYAFNLLYPAITAYRHSHPLLAIPPSPSQEERGAYDWIKENTEIKDTFLVKRQVPNFMTYKDKYGGEEEYRFIKHNRDFITHTGRLITDEPWCEARWCNSLGPVDAPRVSDELARLEQVKQTCQAEILEKLGIGYLYIEANHFPNFEQLCLANNDLELKFQNQEKGEFIKIYKINF